MLNAGVAGAAPLSASRPAARRLLIVGFGSIGVRHARVVRALGAPVEVIVLSASGRGPDDGVDRRVASLDEALSLGPLAAVIANAASHHLAAALPLARAGVHLLIEKPISVSSAGVSALLDTCRALGLTLMTGYNLRFLQSLQRFRQLLGEGVIGRVLSVRAECGQYLPTWRPHVDYRTTVSAQAALGGGVLLELSHEIDYLRWLFGEVEWVRATLARQSDLEIDVEDTAHLVLGFAGERGRPGVMATLSLDFVRRDATRTCMAIGEKGSLRWDAIRGTVELCGEEGAWRQMSAHAQQPDESYAAEWRHFFDCIESGVSPEVSGEDGLAVVRIIEAARRSAAGSGAVPVSAFESAAEPAV